MLIHFPQDRCLPVQSNWVIMLKHFNHLPWISLLRVQTRPACQYCYRWDSGRKPKLQVDKKWRISAIISMLFLLIIHNLDTIACPVRDLRARLAGIIVLRGRVGLPVGWSILARLKHRIITAPFPLPGDRFGRIGLHKVVNWIWDFGNWNTAGIVKGFCCNTSMFTESYCRTWT